MKYKIQFHLDGDTKQIELDVALSVVERITKIGMTIASDKGNYFSFRRSGFPCESEHDNQWLFITPSNILSVISYE